MTFVASPQLSGAVRKALQAFSRHKPHLFGLAREQSEEATLYVNEWAYSLIGVSLDAIPDAATRWIAHKTEIPSPAAFGHFAKEIDRTYYRPPEFVPVPGAGGNRRFAGARPFFYAKEGPSKGYGRLNEQFAIAWDLLGGGAIGISELEMDAIHAGATEWGHLDRRDVPAIAAPPEWGSRVIVEGRR